MNLENIGLLMTRLLDKYDTQQESVMLNFDNGSTLKTGNLRNAKFQRPYKMLLVWAILMNR